MADRGGFPIESMACQNEGEHHVPRMIYCLKKIRIGDYFHALEYQFNKMKDDEGLFLMTWTHQPIFIVEMVF